VLRTTAARLLDAIEIALQTVVVCQCTTVKLQPMTGHCSVEEPDRVMSTAQLTHRVNKNDPLCRGITRCETIIQTCMQAEYDVAKAIPYHSQFKSKSKTVFSVPWPCTALSTSFHSCEALFPAYALMTCSTPWRPQSASETAQDFPGDT